MIEPMIVNMTRHDIKILVPGEVITIPASGQVARLDIANKGLGFTRRGIHLSQSEIIGSLGLPKEEEGIYYIVSSLLASQCPDRFYMTFPDLNCAINGPGEGVVIGSDGEPAGVLRRRDGRLNYDLILHGRRFTIHRRQLFCVSQGNQWSAEVREFRYNLPPDQKTLAVPGVL